MSDGSRIGSCEYGSNMHTSSMIVSESYQDEEIHSDLMQSSARLLLERRPRSPHVS